MLNHVRKVSRIDMQDKMSVLSLETSIVTWFSVRYKLRNIYTCKLSTLGVQK